MKTYVFRNYKPIPIQLLGPQRELISFKPYEKKSLSEWFLRYCPKYIITDGVTNAHNLKLNTSITTPKSRPSFKGKQQRTIRRFKIKSKPKNSKRKVVGTGASGSAAKKHFRTITSKNVYSISNDIGVGILSYNRIQCIERLLISLRKFTDLTKTTVFVSDESSDKKVKDFLKYQQDIVFVDNKTRLGVAGNTNRLMRCLDRFKYKLILNDDVEILKHGWDDFYFSKMEATNIHHFCFNFGATAKHTEHKIKQHTIRTMTEKPPGVVLAFDNKAFETAGFFDESFGVYGMEHVDWSNRISLSNIQLSGFHDVVGSEAYFKMNRDISAVEDRSKHFAKAKERYAAVKGNKKRIFIEATEKSQVPSITFIMPVRGLDRLPLLKTVIKNIRAQKFPRVIIKVVEQDRVQNVDQKLLFVDYDFQKVKEPFCRSKAFNFGVSKTETSNIILHDADLIVPDHYAGKVSMNLNSDEACHIGKNVLYADKNSTDNIVQKEIVEDPRFIRIVNYFEGGSIGIRREAFTKIGGFEERFIGYGVEDLDFFDRLEILSFFDSRFIDFIHLAHSFSADKGQLHSVNLETYEKLKLTMMNDRIREATNSLKMKYEWSKLKNFPQFSVFPKTISIVMSLYNNAKFVGEAIESVQKQIHRDWELVIINDGSTDNSPKVVEKYLKDQRIRLFSQKNGGSGAALRAAISKSSGDIICVLDSDDFLFPTALSEIINIYDSNSEVDIVHSQFYDGWGLKEEKFTKNARIRGNFGEIGSFLQVGTISPLRTFTRRAYDKTAGVSENLRAAIDYDLMLKLEEVARQIHFIQKPLYFYRYNKNSLSSSQKKIQDDCAKNAKKLALERRSRKKKAYNIGIIAGACGISKEIQTRFTKSIEDSCPRNSYVVKIVEGQENEIFNRSKALNNGIKSLLDKCKVIVCTDIDMIVPPGLVDFTFEKSMILEKSVWVICRNIEIEKIKAKDWVGWLKLPLRGDPEGKLGVGRGSWNAMTSELWVESCGWDERMYGWGGEDDEFWQRRLDKGIGFTSVSNFALMHVDHKRRTVSRANENLEIAKQKIAKNWLLS